MFTVFFPMLSPPVSFTQIEGKEKEREERERERERQIKIS